MRMGPPLFAAPAPELSIERRRVQVVELVAALAPDADEAGLLQDVEVLRDRLPRRSDAVLRQQPAAELEQRLAVALFQLVEDRPPRRIRKRLEHIHDVEEHRQAATCMSSSR